MYRDRWSGDDAFGVIVDPFNDNDIGLWFWTTPAGVRGDASISGDGQGGTNDDWDTFWDVATVRTPEGWFAEMRIPLSSLGFQSRDGAAEMAITAYRYIARKNERQVFPEIAPQFDFTRPSLAQDVVLGGVRTHRPVYITPYVLSGVGQTAELSAAGDRYQLDSQVVRELGGDIRYNLRGNLTLDLTANTDFAQVEADDQQVNLTRFSLFFPEKRRFFQERSGVFDFLTGGGTRLFYSRRIGLSDEGAAIPIIGGARLVGRVGNWDLGFLDLQTAESGGVESENFGVLRLRRRVLNDNSLAGLMFTSRVGADGSYNLAYGLDGVFLWSEDDYLGLKWAQTFGDQRPDESGFRFVDAGLFMLTAYDTGERGLSYFFQLRRQGRDYEPEMGFITRRDFTDFFYYLAYFAYPEDESALRRIDPFQLFGSVAFRNEDGTVESAFIEHDFDLQWKAGSSLGLDLELYYEDLREPLDFGEDTEVPPGSYWFPRFEGGYDLPPGGLVRSSLDWGVGRFYDGWRADVGLSPLWNVSRHLELNGEYSLNVIRFPDRDRGFDAHILRFRARLALDTRLSLATFVQFSSAADRVATNVRIRYNFREGNDLWVVYNEGSNLDRDRTEPRLPFTEDRTILLKYTHTFAR